MYLFTLAIMLSLERVAVTVLKLPVDKVKVPRKVISAGEWRGVQVLFTTKSLGLRLLPT